MQTDRDTAQTDNQTDSRVTETDGDRDSLRQKDRQ